MNNAAHEVETAEPEEATETAGRIGLVTRGILYLISAALTVRVAFQRYPSATEEGPGKTGALRTVAEQPFGGLLVAVLMVGLGGYAVWRLAVAAAYQGHDDDPLIEVWTRRASHVGRALLYLVGVATAMNLLITGDPETASSSEDRTRRVFALPAGRWLVGAIGVGIVGAAGYNGYRAWSGSYRRKWSDDLTPMKQRCASTVSATGLIGHMMVLVLVASFLLKAAWEHDPNEPEGIDEAVKALADEPYGTTLLIALAAGMAAYAGFSFIEARWRQIPAND